MDFIPPEIQQMPEEFVHIQNIHQNIRIAPRYAECNNFTGAPLPGYESKTLVVSVECAAALLKVQEHVEQDGYDLVIYDAYRPQKAVDAFKAWSLTDEISQKAWYYPSIEKQDLFPLGYIAEKSGHTRGSTVDVTLIRQDQQLHEKPIPSTRQLPDGREIPFLDDNTVDPFTHFDLFDSLSHHDMDPELIPKDCLAHRNYLRTVMMACGFVPYGQEWWHYTLAQEPYPDIYFTFDIPEYVLNHP